MKKALYIIISISFLSLTTACHTVIYPVKTEINFSPSIKHGAAKLPKEYHDAAYYSLVSNIKINNLGKLACLLQGNAINTKQGEIVITAKVDSSPAVPVYENSFSGDPYYCSLGNTNPRLLLGWKNLKLHDVVSLQLELKYNNDAKEHITEYAAMLSGVAVGVLGAVTPPNILAFTTKDVFKNTSNQFGNIYTKISGSNGFQPITITFKADELSKGNNEASWKIKAVKDTTEDDFSKIYNDQNKDSVDLFDVVIEAKTTESLFARNMTSQGLPDTLYITSKNDILKMPLSGMGTATVNLQQKLSEDVPSILTSLADKNSDEYKKACQKVYDKLTDLDFNKWDRAIALKAVFDTYRPTGWEQDSEFVNTCIPNGVNEPKTVMEQIYGSNFFPAWLTLVDVEMMTSANKGWKNNFQAFFFDLEAGLDKSSKNISVSKNIFLPLLDANVQLQNNSSLPNPGLNPSLTINGQSEVADFLSQLAINTKGCHFYLTNPKSAYLLLIPSSKPVMMEFVLQQSNQKISKYYIY